MFYLTVFMTFVCFQNFSTFYNLFLILGLLVLCLVYSSSSLREFQQSSAIIFGGEVGGLLCNASIFALGLVRTNLYLGDLCVYLFNRVNIFNFFFFSWSFMCRAVFVLYVFFIIF